MKIGLFINSLNLPLFAGIDMAAELGVEGVQLHAATDVRPLMEMSAEEIREVMERCSRACLEIPAICGDLGGYGFERAEDNAAKIPQMRRVIDTAAALGCPVVTSHIGVVPSDRASKQYEVMRAALADIGNYAREKGICLAIETGPEPACVLRQFIEDTGSGGVKVNFDPANLLMVLDEDPVEAVGTLARHIVHTHAKDGVHHRKCDPVEVYHAFAEGGFGQLLQKTGKLFDEVPLGDGQIDWPAYLAALREAGYDGYLTIERETGANPAADIASAISFLKQTIGK